MIKFDFIYELNVTPETLQNLASHISLFPIDVGNKEHCMDHLFAFQFDANCNKTTMKSVELSALHWRDRRRPSLSVWFPTNN